MLSIILLILKIIGIVLAVILGFALFALLLILFVPLRYKVEAKRESEIEAKAWVSWLFHIVYFKITYIGKKQKYCLRIFGIPVFSEKPRKKKKKPSDKKSKDKLDSITDTPESLEKKEVVTMEVKPEDKNTEDKKQEAEPVNATEEKAESKFDSFKRKVKTFLAKITGSREWIRGIKQKIRDMLSVISELLKKAGKVKGFILDKENRPGFLSAINTLRKVLRHIHPKKLIMNVHFGTGDPCSTGQALGAICAIYPRILGKVNLRPNFEDKVFEMDLYARGRVRVVTLLFISIRLIIDHDFKHVLQQLKKLKEEL